MSPVNSMFVCIKKKKISANLFLKWPISIIGKLLNIGADNRSTPSCFNGKVYFFSYLIFHENVPSGFKTRHVFKLRF